MRDNEFGGAKSGLLLRLVGAVVTVAVVSEYIVLAAMTLGLRVLVGGVVEAWSRLRWYTMQPTISRHP
jgi:hypothetical protein